MRSNIIDWQDDLPKTEPLPPRLDMQHFQTIEAVIGEAVKPIIQANNVIWLQLKQFIIDHPFDDNRLSIIGHTKFSARRDGDNFYIGNDRKGWCWQYYLLWSARLNEYHSEPPDWHDVWHGYHAQGVAIISHVYISVDGTKFIREGESSHTLHVGGCKHDRGDKSQHRICYNHGNKLHLHEHNLADLMEQLRINRQRALLNLEVKKDFANYFKEADHESEGH